MASMKWCLTEWHAEHFDPSPRTLVSKIPTAASVENPALCVEKNMLFECFLLDHSDERWENKERLSSHIEVPRSWRTRRAYTVHVSYLNVSTSPCNEKCLSLTLSSFHFFFFFFTSGLREERSEICFKIWACLPFLPDWWSSNTDSGFPALFRGLLRFPEWACCVKPSCSNLLWTLWSRAGPTCK